MTYLQDKFNLKKIMQNLKSLARENAILSSKQECNRFAFYKVRTDFIPALRKSFSLFLYLHICFKNAKGLHPVTGAAQAALKEQPKLPPPSPPPIISIC